MRFQICNMDTAVSYTHLDVYKRQLQIIAPDHFDLAQKLMLERTNERKEHRTVPLNTTGQRCV